MSWKSSFTFSVFKSDYLPGTVSTKSSPCTAFYSYCSLTRNSSINYFINSRKIITKFFTTLIVRFTSQSRVRSWSVRTLVKAVSVSVAVRAAVRTFRCCFVVWRQRLCGRPTPSPRRPTKQTSTLSIASELTLIRYKPQDLIRENCRRRLFVM
jgi:hypothetical protein